MADILLIYPRPDEIKPWRFGFSLHLLYLAAILKQADHHIVDYLDYSIQSYDGKNLDAKLDRSQLIIIEFDAFPLKRAVNIEHGEALIRYIKQKDPQKKIIVFGYDFSLFPRSQEGADLTLASEPERNILKAAALVLGEEPESPGFIAAMSENLDDLPFPDRSLLSPFAESGGSINREPHLARSTLIETSRGCLNRCTFCQRKGWNHAPRRGVHSIDYVAREFSYLQQHRYKNIWITDDNFTYDLKHAKQVLKKLRNENLTAGMKIALSSWTWIDREFLELAGDSGVSIISFGVESADPAILDFYKKKVNLEEFHTLITFAHKTGLYTVGNFILGAPMETGETMERTFKYIQDTPFDQVNIKLLDYMAGSDLYHNLPPRLKGDKRHLFACSENGLNDFPIRYLREKIDRFGETFRALRKEHLERKIKTFGPPYFTTRRTHPFVEPPGRGTPL
ncbi:MAG: radical SAM protein [bacterium]|nr:radical SAM protein [bacterium]